MKILHFVIGRCSPQSPHGVDQAIYYLCREQAAAGADVAAFCLSSKPVVPIPGVDVRNFAAGPKPVFAMSLPRAYRAAVRQWEPDFIHLHGAYVPANLAMARFARKEGIPYAVTAHGNLSSRLLQRKPWLKIPYKVLFERPMLNRAAFVHAIADESEIRAFGADRPIVTAPNGFDLRDVVPAGANEDVLTEFPSFKDKILLVYLGRLDVEQKGLDVLLEAFADAARRTPKLHLALAGATWREGRSRLEALAQQLGVQDQVTFCGMMQGSRKYALLRASHLFLHPSRWEAGVPFAVMEALAVGKPCIISPAADPLKRLEAAQAGRVSEPVRAKLAAAIDELANAPASQLQAMSRAATSLIEREFTWARSAKILLEGYSAAMNRN